MDLDALRVLRELNPWLEAPGGFSAQVAPRIPDAYLERAVSPRLAARLAEGAGATLVIGPRQAGKSTLVWRHLRDLEPPVLYLDAQERSVRALCESAATFAGELREVAPGARAIFIEEAQHLKEAGLFVKGLIDLRVGCPVLVTGSSSYHLRAKTRESLAGRAEYFRLMPLDLAEAASVDPAVPPAIARARRGEALERHVRFGGYPEAWLSADPERVLHRLVRAHLLRDASDLYRVRDLHAFRRLLSLAAMQAGSLVNLSEWARALEVQRSTVADWIGLLEETHVLASLPVFAGGRRAELTSARKVYFVDVGLRNALVESFVPLDSRADRGALLEGWVFSELHKDERLYERLHYWRTRSGAEMDFVIDGPKGIVAIEVKAGGQAGTLSRSARSFLEAYQPSALLIVSTRAPFEDRICGVPVRGVHPLDLRRSVLEALASAAG